MKCIATLIAAVVDVSLCLSALRIRILNDTTTTTIFAPIQPAEFRAAHSTMAALFAAAYFGTRLFRRAAWLVAHITAAVSLVAAAFFGTRLFRRAA